MDGLSLLAELRDVHPPDPVSWWPPALGWWIAAGLAVAAAVAAWRAWRAYRRSPRRAAKLELGRIEAAFAADPDHTRLAVELSRLLRRCALARFPAERVAGLEGEAWLRFLDEAGETRAFTRGPGRTVTLAPYARSCSFAADEVLSAVSAWLEVALARRWRRAA